MVSNAGSTNPLMCAAALDKMARKAGVDLKIAVVTGDDILGEVIDIHVIDTLLSKKPSYHVMNN